MTDAIEQYFEFMRYCVDVQRTIPYRIDKMNWERLYAFAMQQAISAFFFDGIERLVNNGLSIPRVILCNWIAESERIKLRNQLINQRCVELIKILREDGYECCVLKGQGNAVMYPNPYSRAPGDIDLWLKPQELDSDYDTFVQNVIAYSKTKNPGGVASTLHVDYGEFCGVEVELHYCPANFCNPFFNKRLLCWIKQQEKNVFENKCILPNGCMSARQQRGIC